MSVGTKQSTTLLGKGAVSIFSQGSAKTLVSRGGKIEHVLIADYQGENSAKNYYTRAMLSQFTAKNLRIHFMRLGVVFV